MNNRQSKAQVKWHSIYEMASWFDSFEQLINPTLTVCLTLPPHWQSLSKLDASYQFLTALWLGIYNT